PGWITTTEGMVTATPLCITAPVSVLIVVAVVEASNSTAGPVAAPSSALARPLDGSSLRQASPAVLQPRPQVSVCATCPSLPHTGSMSAAHAVVDGVHASAASGAPASGLPEAASPPGLPASTPVPEDFTEPHPATTTTRTRHPTFRNMRPILD